MQYSEAQLSKDVEHYSKIVKGRPSWSMVAKMLHEVLTTSDLDMILYRHLVLIYIGASRNARNELAQRKPTANA